MTFLSPIFFYLGVAAAAGAVALHFIVTRQPSSTPLPTTRFVPISSERVTTIARPEHWWLLLVRVLVALLVGAAFARPVLTPTPRPMGRIVLADVSRDAREIGELRDSVRALLRQGDALVIYDTAARAIRGGATDSVATLEQSGATA
ncbi:MAG TPA: BatA domain-containing protein, partial [Gemmatimonadaceae bacterium]|nr:BatA domain-containing protein [Gemmatimonadaceae bacterium]